MFTPNTENSGIVYVSPVQEAPLRLNIYSIDRCMDQTIGFEFLTNEYPSNPKCFGKVLVNLCVPVPIVSEIVLTSAEFVATDDPCFKDFIVDINTFPEIELIRNPTGNVTGILVRFYRQDTCCYPTQMAFQLWGYDANGCKSILARGLLSFR